MESVTEVNGRAVFDRPKTHQRRSVPLPRFLVESIAAHIAGRAGDEPLFTSPADDVLRNTNFRRRVFDRAAQSIGLAGLTPHELRHTPARLAVAEGVNVKAVQRMLGTARAPPARLGGHELDVYADLFEDDLDQVAGCLYRAAGCAAADSVRTECLGPDLDVAHPGDRKGFDQGKQLVDRRYHHANQSATIAGDPLPLGVRRSGARLIGPAQDQAI